MVRAAAAALMVVCKSSSKTLTRQSSCMALSKVESSDYIDNVKPNIQKESTSCAWDCVVVCR
jgi:hypothetical protein